MLCALRIRPYFTLYLLYMRKFYLLATAALLLSVAACSPARHAARSTNGTPFLWENANLYFLLTDRFYNADKNNDVNFGRTQPTGLLRGFMGGDLAGITKKIKEGYFDRLGVTALWFTPVVEQIHGGVDEGTGFTYGYHGYWAKDWTRLDPNFGSEKEFRKLVETAHAHGIRVVLDVVINHTGPTTPQDPLWTNWARTGPKCTYKDYTTTTACTLVDNLPDIYTESDKPVDLPPFLLEKWKKEGRLERELAELDAFFQRTGYPRAPRFYLIKWLTDYIRKYGVDGYRCDTAKHLEESVWGELRKEADLAFADWKHTHPTQVLDHNPFFMVGEVYFYNISTGRKYDFGDHQADYYANGFNALINFELKSDASRLSYEAMFAKYSELLHSTLSGYTVLNYMTSHDDGSPFDKLRKKPLETGTRLLLCPGSAQIYYGDETARPLDIPGTQGDATLRSFMNWDELAANTLHDGISTQAILTHWQRLGSFRKAHPAVGAGMHHQISAQPYTFRRSYQSGTYRDDVVVGLDLPIGKKSLSVEGVFPDGTMLSDTYSGQKAMVSGGRVILDTPYSIMLLGK